jgi:hypothetical protein
MQTILYVGTTKSERAQSPNQNISIANKVKSYRNLTYTRTHFCDGGRKETLWRTELSVADPECGNLVSVPSSLTTCYMFKLKLFVFKSNKNRSLYETGGSHCGEF